MEKQFLKIILLILFAHFSVSKAVVPKSSSFYRLKPSDPEAVYFTPDNYKIKADGKTDVTEALQGAINKLKLEQNFGIIFIPEGTYVISKTIYIPGAIRIIGYGQKRPVFVLKKNTPGYQEPVLSDKGKANYMFWFTSSVVEEGKPVNDAGAGTFYSCLSNIDIVIEEGNPEAVALRTHYAQHSFVSHCDVNIGKGKAGLFDIGNYMEDVRFFGGEYGIYTTKASPGWQFMMLDTYFEGQRKAAIKTQQAGLTIVRMNVRNVPKVIDVDPDFWEKLYMEDCQLVNVTGPVVSFENEGNDILQINMRNITCQNVPLVAEYQRSGTFTKGSGNIYRIKRFVYGLQMEDLTAEQEFKTVFEQESLAALPAPAVTDITPLPGMDSWVSLKELGAKGDGENDDTEVLKKAIEQYKTIYLPQGLYRISETIKLKPGTVIIGLHPIATQIILGESTPAFSGFGSPKPMIETEKGGDNIITGIGIFTGEYNYRAVACKWSGSSKSLMDDVKFVGGHGSMKKGPYVPWAGYGDQTRKPQPIAGPDPAWDTQYWSLWITNGGGIFKNIWTASSYAVSGIYVSNTSTPGKIYAMSVEHHVRNEVRFHRVSNWKMYALQLEEESREGVYCQPMEISNCSNLVFANLYMFRVIRFKTPYPYSVRTWDCSNLEFLNVHNYSQIKFTTDNPLYDINTNTEVRPSELARLFISGRTPVNNSVSSDGPARMLARGFEFAEGMCSDSKGNVYFSEQRLKRIYRWSAETNTLDLIADYPWEPLSLGCDTEDNLLVVFRYNPQFGHKVNGVQEKFTNPPDASGTSFSMWGNSGFATLAYSVDPANPDETLAPLRKEKMVSLTKISKALYPSNRWRDYHDFNKVVVNRNEECWVAPDGKTIIPVCYDLARSSGMAEAFPGKKLYVSNEYDKRTVSLDVDDKGYVSGLKAFAEKGEFSSVPAVNGDVYIADGDIYVINSEGRQKGIIHIPERPNTLAFGGKDRKTLFVTGREALYSAVYKPVPDFKVLAVASADPDHDPMIIKSKAFLEKIAEDNNFEITVTRDASLINEENLANYKVFVMLHLAPFDMTLEQQIALQHFVERGNGWVGVHAAGLTGTQFKGPDAPYWMWFEHLMGDIIYSPHPAKQTGTIIVEDRNHPVTKDLPESFRFYDEWYEFNKSPRAKVHVLATADEKSYQPAIPMGDHPMIWVNEKFERVIYIGIGHDTTACTDPNFSKLMRNAILWAAEPSEDKEIRTVENSLKQEITILVNQVAYDLNGLKTAIVRSSKPLPFDISFEVLDAIALKNVFTGKLSAAGKVDEWNPGIYYSKADFSEFQKSGYYKIFVRVNGKEYSSYDFEIGDKALGKKAIPAITSFFFHQRAGSPQEQEADKSIILYGSDKTVDLRGGWCDASGDISKYFSHLAYTNYMNPQQTPMVTWSMANTVEKAGKMLAEADALDKLRKEAIYGADYILKSLSPEGYFYMTVFTYFNRDPKARRVVGLLADSKTTSDYQCGFREGGGMGVAALARISQWGMGGEFTSKQYLESAEKAFAHLLVNSPKYADDGKENIIDDYCALMGATELWIATGKDRYRNEARKRAGNLEARMTPQGYFNSNDSGRPFWHAADAGLPVIALARYLEKEEDKALRSSALETIKKALDYNLKVTSEVINPFGYPRQSFLYKGKVQNGFFIPHENESGWWWQGEDARLGSLAAAAIVGGRLVYPGTGAYGVRKDLAEYASNAVSWILGCNPYNICMMYGYGTNNVPYMSAMYGHGSGRGGISNGITGKDGNGNGSGIDFKMEDNGNEWRWSEQWIPHTGWFLQAVTAMSSDK